MKVKLNYHSGATRHLACAQVRLEDATVLAGHHGDWRLLARRDGERWLGRRRGVIDSVSIDGKNAEIESDIGAQFLLHDPEGFSLRLGERPQLRRRANQDEVAEFVYDLWHTAWGDRLQSICLRGR